MKRLRQLFVIFTIVMVVGLLMFYSIGKKTTYEKRDIVYYNDLLYQVEADIEAGLPETDIEDKYNCVLAMSKKINDPELAPLYAEGAIILDVEVKGEYIGKVGWNDIKGNFNKASHVFYKAALVLWLAVLASGYLLLLYMYLVFLIPIEELKGFATDIAKGELDKSLPIRKNSMFGSFIEGFDIMREQLKASINRERQAEIARKELIQGLSHDIKTPLAVIKAACEVIEIKSSRKINELSDDDSKEADEYKDLIDKVRSISDKADTISSLMSDVMHANLEDLEKIDVTPREENSTIIEEFLSNLSDYGKIILENHIHPCLVYMDRIRMEQVIDNVVGNSNKYAGTDIRVNFSQTEEMPMADGSKASFIKITIKDNGPGVDRDDLPLIAEKYYRGNNASNQTGYGLGMYLVKTYMGKQGGGLEYYNDNGFVVELLLRKV
ncbi:MAG: hypothetical protein K5877_08615 [Lachnospiraceae bacterium]|nr:hypothetical protein [Lachnospiraceae bacterium]